MLAINPSHTEAYINLGAIQATLGKLSDAIPCFQAALRLSPDSAAAHANLGSAFIQQKQPALAEPSLRRGAT